MKKRKILVTSALPYANGPIHVGHIAGAYLPADIYVRYQRLKGNEVIYICGTDEHGVPITLTAEKEKKSPQEIVDKFYENIKNSFEGLGISFDNFSRTSLPIHYSTSQEFFLNLYHKGYVETRIIKQHYCPYCSRFLPDRYVTGDCPNCGIQARGDQCEGCGTWLEPIQLNNVRCMICQGEPEIRETKHWFFKLSSFQKKLEEWIYSQKDWKDNVINYSRGWLEKRLEDRPITRDMEWGVPVPLEEAKGKVLYVWFDAPIGYISSTKEWAQKIGQPDKWKYYWMDANTELIHFIGKDNIIFHALLFPAMMMGHENLVLPSQIPANEFLNIEGQKISTSRNWAVWIPDYLEKFPPDPLRYYIALNAPETRDCDFTWKDFQAKNNSELADILGNFIHRVIVFTHKYFQGKLPAAIKITPREETMLSRVAQFPEQVGNLLERFQLKAATREFMNLAREGNRYFDECAPWVTRKQDKEQCATTINVCLRLIATLAVIMHPFMPFTADKTCKMLNMEKLLTEISWDNAGKIALPTGHPLGRPEVLFNKIEDSMIEEEIEKLGQPA